MGCFCVLFVCCLCLKFFFVCWVSCVLMVVVFVFGVFRWFFVEAVLA